MSKTHATDIGDEQWDLLAPHVAPEKRRGPKSHVDMRGVINAIFYRLRIGCQWRLLPKEYPSWPKVAGYWQRWSRNGKWEQINKELREAVRLKAGEKPTPTVAIIDSQSVKTVQKDPMRVDGRLSW